MCQYFLRKTRFCICSSSILKKTVRLLMNWTSILDFGELHIMLTVECIDPMNRESPMKKPTTKLFHSGSTSSKTSTGISLSATPSTTVETFGVDPSLTISAYELFSFSNPCSEETPLVTISYAIDNPVLRENHRNISLKRPLSREISPISVSNPFTTEPFAFDFSKRGSSSSFHVSPSEPSPAMLLFPA